MDRSTKIYWAIIVILLSCSIFFYIKVHHKTGSLKKATAKLENGDIVHLHKVVDGDTIIVRKNTDEQIMIRIVGIKSFDEGSKSDETTPYMKAAVHALNSFASEKPIRVLLHSATKDKHGRVLATIFSGDQDIALKLISHGLVLVYTKYPFPAMSLYLQQQEIARANGVGLWANKDAASRAGFMIQKWQDEGQ
ncbi:MAG: thermonuclease family protein [Nitrospirae bacterium YQR-1]